jgi:hypothetical protein
MNDYDENMLHFLDPTLLREKLAFFSLFIAIYENFKYTIVEHVRWFYCNGFQDGKPTFDDYGREVLSKVESGKNKEIRATLLWLEQADAININDSRFFREITNLRNSLAHDMAQQLLSPLKQELVDQCLEMLALFEKIERWWIIQVELPTDPDSPFETDESTEPEMATSLNVEFLKMATTIVLTSADKYKRMYQDLLSRTKNK